ncbi:hypothetical protein ACFRCG_06995 [Embleya sp. NPDC056575]|uniref:tetratricopeptide repeat protein n=1 Tax=unclassified Embleya TaxID=2699296 RepID=UPI0036CE0850
MDIELRHPQQDFFDRVPPNTVTFLLERGHVDAVVEAAHRGEWECARGAVEHFLACDEPGKAWGVIAPFVATGRWSAVREAAPVLRALGRGGEAIAMVRAHAEGGVRDAWNTLARLLADDGRIDEAIEALRPRLCDWYHLEALVEVSEGRGRDARVIDLLRRVCGGGGPWNRAIMLARVFERGGRVDEAVEVLRVRIDDPAHMQVNDVEELTAVLARHDRLDELRLLTDGPHARWAFSSLAQRLEESGRVDEAIEVRRRAARERMPYAAGALALLLARVGRPGEAVEAVGPALDGADCGCLLYGFLDVLVAAGGAVAALELVTAAAERNPHVAEHARSLRPWLLSEAGRGEEAIAEVVARIEKDDERRAVEELAQLLDAEGRVEEAIAALWEYAADTGSGRVHLARMLIGQGRVEDAIAMHQLPKPRVVSPADDPWGPPVVEPASP